MAALNQITTFLFFIQIMTTSLFHLNQALTKHINPSSLVLGLSLSKVTLQLPKASSFYKNSIRTRATRPMESLDIIEPLRDIRDGYLMSLTIGTPPQVIQVYMDTGSDLTWVPCGNLTFDCIDCDDYRTNKAIGSYSPTYSSTSYRDSCGSSFCVNIHSSDTYLDTCTMAGCSLSTLVKSICSRPCPSFAYTYGGGGAVTGSLARDTLRVHGVNPSIIKEIQKFCFGCVGSTYHEPIGIVGFGRGSLSLPSQLGFLEKGFSHCFLPFKYANNPNISSPLVIGDVALSSSKDSNMQYTPMLRNPMYPNYYYIGLEAISVDNLSATQVPSSLREFDSQGNGGMLIDSGTTYTHLPEPFYSELLSTLQSLIDYPRAIEVEKRKGFDLCYTLPSPSSTDNSTSTSSSSSNDTLLPTITFHFRNNASVVLPQGSHFYAVSAPNNSTVVKCLLFQSMDDATYGPAGVFGNFQQQNLRVVYDLQNERIGFQAMDCASAAASQGLHRY